MGEEGSGVHFATVEASASRQESPTTPVTPVGRMAPLVEIPPTPLSLSMEEVQRMVSQAVQQDRASRRITKVRPPRNVVPRTPLWDEGMNVGPSARSSIPPLRQQRGNPFSAEIMASDLPVGFQALEHLAYDGTTDPWDHISRFQTTSYLHRFSDGIMCRAFATTLRDATQLWFGQLAEGSVRDFDTFSAMLLDHFASSKKQKKSALTLFGVRQEDREPLRNFIRRFTNVSREVPGLSQDVLNNALMQGLRDGELFRSLAKRAPTTYDELLKRAENYIAMEEAKKMKEQETAVVPVHDTPVRSPPREENLPRQQRHPAARAIPVPEHRKPRYTSYAVLNKSPTQVLMAIEGGSDIRWPTTYQKTPPPPQGSSDDGYCRYHNRYGHRTNECGHLKDKQERLARQSRIDQFVKTLAEGHTAGRHVPQPRASVEPINRIIMIMGGPTDGDSHRVRKKYVRSEKRAFTGEWIHQVRECSPTISFGEEDKLGVVRPYSDALVITAHLAGYEVSRVFVDNGSSVDILYKECLDQMRLGELNVSLVKTPAMGFRVRKRWPLARCLYR
ncbi:PREDICTED: uncharacterized protein LOC105952498 [Erythranthe guttata]|uniref:uncharacterized protein LOC105952498 n=1 Tax=Erythranthe guttata TaxID=4155 RepID=UPI00064D75C2|nr:PREDICTED: uncharacterized protein LOC105952498 [Erythranthe guttata]|eukprot:XP_012831513.1 PREDICTED: uncharacterized protein LOC105952498 [Erythranthe guttata]